MKTNNPLFPKSVLTRNQKQVFTVDDVTITNADGTREHFRKAVCEVRFDDACGNGHNTFAITGSFWRHENRKINDPDICGCCHDAVAQAFPQLAHLIKWHGCTTDGPLHYIANTRYFARSCDTEGKSPGDAIAWDTRIKFGEFPVTFKKSDRFTEWLRTVPISALDLKVIAIYHDKEPATYGAKYTFGGYPAAKWHECPFDTETQALEFLEAIQRYRVQFVKTPTKFAQEVNPNLEAARDSACWPDATREQLLDEAQLLARLPALMHDFKNDMEAIGFTY